MNIVKYCNDRIDGASVKIAGRKDPAELLLCAALLHGAPRGSDSAHPSREELLLFAEKGLASGDAVAAHLSTCAACRTAVRELAALSRADGKPFPAEVMERAFAAKQSRFSIPALPDVGRLGNYLPALGAVVIFVLLAGYVLSGLFSDRDDIVKFRVKADPARVDIIAADDEVLVGRSGVGADSGRYDVTDAKMLRAGYAFFMVQKSSSRREILEDIVARDVSTSSSEHLQNAIYIGEGSLERILDTVQSYGPRKADRFTAGYSLAYLVYRYHAGMSGGAAEDETESAGLDDIRTVEAFIDDFDRKNRTAEASRQLRLDVLTLRLQ